MTTPIQGIHHVTAIASDPQKNIDFYTGVLGLRLVKQTVNFDDPGTYHFYYGDELGRPGTLLTFFPIPRAFQGQRGAGQVTVTGLSIPDGALDYWRERLEASGARVEEPFTRFDETALTFYDPDDLQLELVESKTPGPGVVGQASPIPESAAVRGVSHVQLQEEGYERTAALLTETLGFRLTQSADNRFRFEAGTGGHGATVDLVCTPGALPGRVAAGSVHHVAFRTPDDEAQLAWRRALIELGYNVSPVMDRQYFHSIYFREPGGVLFEIATDAPGFAVDEPVEALGTSLRLPPAQEMARAMLERRLPKITLPGRANS